MCLLVDWPLDRSGVFNVGSVLFSITFKNDNVFTQENANYCSVKVNKPIDRNL